MPDRSDDGAHPTPSLVALSTKLEEDFVAPLTAVRGALEILRDHPDLAEADRRRFVEAALRGCARLGAGVEHLAATVYQAGRAALADRTPPAVSDVSAYAARIRLDRVAGIAEIDLSDVRFSDSATVNAFYDVVDALVERSGRRWYFLVDYKGCNVWPEAWVAFAHRGKKVHIGYSLGTVRFAELDGERNPDERLKQFGASDPDFCTSRAAGLARIGEMKRARRERPG